MQQLITIYTFTYPYEAAIIQGRLESEGIETFLKDELTVQTYHFYSNAVGGIKLQVWEEDAEQAVTVLKDAGYVFDEPLSEHPFWLWLESSKERIPIFNNKNPFYFLMLIVTVITLTIGGIIFLIIRPSTSELLYTSHWCVNYLVYKNVEYRPKTVDEMQLRFDGDCMEQIIFYKSGGVKLPGFNTRSIHGSWYVDGSNLRIRDLTAYGNVYDDLFKIEMNGDLLTLTSDSTTIYAYKHIDFFKRRGLW